jgi:serine/threonine-protein kinase
VLNSGLSDDPLSDAAINLGSTQHATESLAYLAPEQVRDPSNVDARVDIWALGALLHEMLAGVAPFVAENTPGLLAAIAAEEPMPLSHLRPEIPEELEAVVLRCLAKSPRDRFASVAELAQGLAPFASDASQAHVLRVARALGRRSGTSLPPPLPGSKTRAIVKVPAAPPPVQPSALPVPPPPSRRWAELALTALALAAAGALGVFVAVRTMENALANALAPRQVVADLSPALPALPALPAAQPAPAAPASVAPQPVAPRPAARRTPAKPLTERAVVAVAPTEPPALAPSPTGLFDDAN